MDNLKQYWYKLNQRERYIVSGGLLIALLLIFYVLLWQPWHKAIDSMSENLPAKRQNLVWMEQQAELLQGSGGLSKTPGSKKGAGQSLLSIIEKTGKLAALSKSIQQMSPGETEQEVRLVLSQVDFNAWVRWTSILADQYGIEIKELSAQRQLKDAPNRADIRMTLVR